MYVVVEGEFVWNVCVLCAVPAASDHSARGQVAGVGMMSPNMGCHPGMDTSVHHMRVESSREPSIAASPPPLHHLLGATGSRPPPPLPPPRFPNSAV